jgi:hypothetical protein
MERQTTVWKMVYVFDPERIGASMGYFVNAVALEGYVTFTAKYCPNSTHC